MRLEVKDARSQISAAVPGGTAIVHFWTGRSPSRTELSCFDRSESTDVDAVRSYCRWPSLAASRECGTSPARLIPRAPSIANSVVCGNLDPPGRAGHEELA